MCQRGFRARFPSKRTFRASLPSKSESSRCENPPTPAFAKAGAAPGTTAGVELVFLSNRHPKATSMAFYGRPSLPFASPKTLQTPKTPQRPLPWLLMGFQRRQKLPQGQIHCCFWAVQRAVRQAFAANGHPKATSMA